ncbi:MAG: putative Zn-dependent protease [Sphingobacteriales bacterium]
MKYTKGFLLIGTVALATGIYFMPRTPTKVVEEQHQELSDLERAVYLIENGENPMEGITILKRMELEDEDNHEVTWLLAKFSLMSGQIDKALPRLQKLTEQAGTEYPEAVLLYARSLVGGEEEAKALTLLQDLVEHEKDTAVVSNAQALLKNLSSTNP